METGCPVLFDGGEAMFEDRGWPHPEQVGKGVVTVMCGPETLF